MVDNVTPEGDGWRKNTEKVLIKDAETDLTADVITRVDGQDALCVDMSSDIEIGAVEIKDGNSDLRADVDVTGAGNALLVETIPVANSVQNVRVQDGDGTDLADVVVRTDTKKALCVDVASDIEIGAVEIKNATSDDRAVVKNDGTDNALVVVQNVVPTTTVQATDLDIRDLAFASDAVDVSGSSINATVTATDLDIRDLDNTQDDILVYGFDGVNNQPVSVDATGNLQVDILSIPSTSVQSATTPNEYVVNLVVANTEYSQALPANTKGFSFKCRENQVIRFAFTTGKVAGSTEPYFTLNNGNSSYFEKNLNVTGKTIYFACGVANRNVEIIVWS